MCQWLTPICAERDRWALEYIFRDCSLECFISTFKLACGMDVRNYIVFDITITFYLHMLSWHPLQLQQSLQVHHLAKVWLGNALIVVRLTLTHSPASLQHLARDSSCDSLLNHHLIKMSIIRDLQVQEGFQKPSELVVNNGTRPWKEFCALDPT